MARVDVIIPCYQYGRFLRDSVKSAVTQDIDLRVLIIDNASTDDSLEVANELAAQDPRIEVISRKKNLGRHASYNEGIDWVSADYFALCDADDLLAPDCLKRAVSFMELHPDLSFTFGVERRLLFPAGVIPSVEQHQGHPTWEVSSGTDFIRLLCHTARCHVGPTSLVRRTSAQRKVGYHRPELRYTDDLEMFLRLATVGNVAYTPAVQAIRRLHDTQLSRYYDEAPVRDYIERQAAFDSFFAHEGSQLPDAASLHRRARQRLADQTFWSGVSHLCRRKPRIGWELLKYSWARSPLSFLVPPVSHFFIMDRPLTRLSEVVVETITGKAYGRFAHPPVVADANANHSAPQRAVH